MECLLSPSPWAFEAVEEQWMRAREPLGLEEEPFWKTTTRYLFHAHICFAWHTYVLTRKYTDYLIRIHFLLMNRLKIELIEVNQSQKPVVSCFILIINLSRGCVLTGFPDSVLLCTGGVTPDWHRPWWSQQPLSTSFQPTQSWCLRGRGGMFVPESWRDKLHHGESRTLWVFSENVKHRAVCFLSFFRELWGKCSHSVFPLGSARLALLVKLQMWAAVDDGQDSKLVAPVLRLCTVCI